MTEWIIVGSVLLVALLIVGAYVEGRRSRGQTASAVEAMTHAAHQITLDQLEDALDNENATHKAARIVLDERRIVLDAMRVDDPAARHRMLLASQGHTTGTAPASGGAGPGSEERDPGEATELELHG